MSKCTNYVVGLLTQFLGIKMHVEVDVSLILFLVSGISEKYENFDLKTRIIGIYVYICMRKASSWTSMHI